MSRRVAVAFVVAVLVAGALVTTWTAFERSLVPVALEGEVDRVVMRHGKLGGSDDVWQLWMADGRSVTVDRAVAARLADDQVVEKPAWSRTITADGDAVELPIGTDVWRSALAGLVAVAVGVWAVRRRPAAAQ